MLDSFYYPISYFAPKYNGSSLFFLQEFDKHPFFMSKPPENPTEISPLVEGIQQLKYDESENSPEGNSAIRLILMSFLIMIFFLHIALKFFYNLSFIHSSFVTKDSL